nr:hypothetical protein Iba_scaffold10073CG0010 [Ipomoea batatas]
MTPSKMKANPAAKVRTKKAKPITEPREERKCADVAGSSPVHSSWKTTADGGSRSRSCSALAVRCRERGTSSLEGKMPSTFATVGNPLPLLTAGTELLSYAADSLRQSVVTASCHYCHFAQGATKLDGSR